MTYRCIDYTGDRAVVVATPSWVARMFGARDIVFDLVLDPGHPPIIRPEWTYAATWRKPSSEVLSALESREIGDAKRYKPSTGGVVVP